VTPEPTPSLPTLADSLAGTFPACDDAPLLRRLAQGEPVEPPSAGSELATALARWPNVERDSHGRVVAFSGLSLTPSAHRLTVNRRVLYTWCAWDTLSCRRFSTNPRTVDPSGFSDVHPEELWVSFPAPATAIILADAFELGRLATRCFA
jgi:hypothetical protein